MLIELNSNKYERLFQKQKLFYKTEILKFKPKNYKRLAYSSRWLWDIPETQVGKQKQTTEEYLNHRMENFLKDIAPSGTSTRHLTTACVHNTVFKWYVLEVEQKNR